MLTGSANAHMNPTAAVNWAADELLPFSANPSAKPTIVDGATGHQPFELGAPLPA